MWGNYWYCIHQGEGLHNWLIESILIEGEADAFAESIFGDLNPSWHYGVRAEEEESTWKAISSVAQSCLPPEETGKYIFGCPEIGIPQNAGYYFGIKIIRDYMSNNSVQTMEELLKIPLDTIYFFYEKHNSNR